MAYDPCSYCLSEVRVTWWDQIIGLATQCPKCGGYSGPPWTPNRLIIAAFASLVVNALVLIFFARPLRAIVLIVLYVASVAALFAGSSASGNDGLFFTALVAVAVGPVCIAAIEYFWHALELEQGPLRSIEVEEGEDTPDDAALPVTTIEHAAPTFLGTADLERFRNHLEIAIFHQVSSLDLMAKGAYVISLLSFLLAILNRHWVDVSVAAVLAGLAYSAREHESRIFALAYASAGVALLVRFIHTLIQGVDDPSLSMVVAVLVCGILMIRSTVVLAKLRRIRSRIHLPPAEHLAD